MHGFDSLGDPRVFFFPPIKNENKDETGHVMKLVTKNLNDLSRIFDIRYSCIVSTIFFKITNNKMQLFLIIDF